MKGWEVRKGRGGGVVNGVGGKGEGGFEAGSGENG
jgi:hypothetical protein